MVVWYPVKSVHSFGNKFPAAPDSVNSLIWLCFLWFFQLSNFLERQAIAYILFFFLTKLPIYCYFRCQCEFSVSHLGNEFAFSVCKNKRCAISSFGVLNVFYWLCINVELWFWSATPSFHGYILLYLFTWILGIKSPKSTPLCFRVMVTSCTIHLFSFKMFHGLLVSWNSKVVLSFLLILLHYFFGSWMMSTNIFLNTLSWYLCNL